MSVWLLIGQKRSYWLLVMRPDLRCQGRSTLPQLPSLPPYRTPSGTTGNVSEMPRIKFWCSRQSQYNLKKEKAVRIVRQLKWTGFSSAACQPRQICTYGDIYWSELRSGGALQATYVWLNHWTSKVEGEKGWAKHFVCLPACVWLWQEILMILICVMVKCFGIMQRTCDGSTVDGRMTRSE